MGSTDLSDPSGNKGSLRLTIKQRLFVEYYVNNGGNATEAARQAGYVDPENSAWNVRHHPLVAAAVEAKLQQVMPKDEVLIRLTEQAAADLGDFDDCFEERDEVIGVSKHGSPISATVLRFSLARAKQKHLSHLVKKVIRTKHGDQIELHDSQLGLQLFARHYGLLQDRLRVEADVDLSQLSDEQLDRLAKRTKPSQ